MMKEFLSPLKHCVARYSCVKYMFPHIWILLDTLYFVTVFFNDIQTCNRSSTFIQNKLWYKLYHFTYKHNLWRFIYPYMYSELPWACLMSKNNYYWSCLKEISRNVIRFLALIYHGTKLTVLLLRLLRRVHKLLCISWQRNTVFR